MRNNKGQFIKGSKPWNTGRILEYIPHFKKRGQPSWNKGIKVSPDSLLEKDFSLYRKIHRNIEKMFGKYNHCEECGLTNQKKYNWANLSGKYLETRTDWMRLCTQCHAKLDNVNQKVLALYK